MKPTEYFRLLLVEHFKHIFLVFKQHYTHFYILFYPYVFQKNTNNITQTLLPNEPLIFREYLTFGISNMGPHKTYRELEQPHQSV